MPPVLTPQKVLQRLYRENECTIVVYSCKVPHKIVDQKICGKYTIEARIKGDLTNAMHTQQSKNYGQNAKSKQCLIVIEDFDAS